MSRYERELTEALDEKALWDSLKPAIAAILKHGSGSAQMLLKKSEALAAVTLLTSLASKKDDVRLKAAIELLNRSLGKPVERRIDVYADINSLNENELDTQIKSLMRQVGEKGTFEAVLNQVPKLAKTRYRSPNKPKALKQKGSFDRDETLIIEAKKPEVSAESSSSGDKT